MDAYTGLECSSLSYLNVVCQGDIVSEGGSTSGKKQQRGSNGRQEIDCTPPDYILPGTPAADRLLLPLHPTHKDANKFTCLKVFTTSPWNPPPGHR